jgi:hypothetical protein
MASHERDVSIIHMYCVGSKEETQSKDGVSDVSGVDGVGFSGDNSEPADYRSERSEASGIGAQKIHDNNTNTINQVATGRKYQHFDLRPNRILSQHYNPFGSSNQMVIFG